MGQTYAKAELFIRFKLVLVSCKLSCSPVIVGIDFNVG